MTEQADQAAANEQGNDNAMEFSLQRVYLKDLSFESPLGARAFTRQWKPKVNQDLSTKIARLDDNHFEVVLDITITVKDDTDTLYLVEVKQAGVFFAKGLNEQQLAGILNTQCPSILFPYVRETIDSVVTRGTFPALMLPPINFDALFQQAVANANAKAAESQGQAAETPAH
ncbi:MAG: protein-export chaperone SecB [Porticoccaceae bacterium]|jgi:preprotein translocase subunit SecB|nr:protein-export chaperone SecB [Porticoccaceae bacterium]MEA3298975.1 protein-export chaperone SecB [Pseudomonadota bacterium]HLS99533.1 protein-export chaperone SecB [Porticoccaceae bacterium]